MKRSRKTLILLCALVLLAGGYLLLQKLNQKTETKEESGTYTLTEKSASDLAGISWTYKETACSFLKKDDVWSNAENADFPVKQNDVQALADKLLSLTAVRRLSGVQSMADFGLDTPAFTVTAAWKDGTDTAYSMGAETPFKDGYYLSLSGEKDTVYTVKSSLSDTFGKTLTDLAALETLPAADNVTRLTAGALDASYKEISIVPDSSRHWYDTDSGEALDGEAVEKLISGVKELAWKELVTARAMDDELASWQLSDDAQRVTLFNGEETALELLTGTANDAGDYYVRLPESRMVYTVAADDLSSVLAGSMQTLYDKKPFDFPFNSLKSVTFTAGQSAWAFERTETAAADGELQTTAEAGADNTGITEAAVTLNGAETDAEEAENIWAQLQSLSATGREAVSGAQGEAILAAAVTGENNVSVVYAFTTRDADSYLLQISEKTGLLFPADKVDKLIRLLKQL